jgi:hypothetical protein
MADSADVYTLGARDRHLLRHLITSQFHREREMIICRISTDLDCFVRSSLRSSSLPELWGRRAASQAGHTGGDREDFERESEATRRWRDNFVNLRRFARLSARFSSFAIYAHGLRDRDPMRKAKDFSGARLLLGAYPTVYPHPSTPSRVAGPPAPTPLRPRGPKMPRKRADAGGRAALLAPSCRSSLLQRSALAV